MKRKGIGVLLAAVMAFGIAACDSGDGFTGRWAEMLAANYGNVTLEITHGTGSEEKRERVLIDGEKLYYDGLTPFYQLSATDGIYRYTKAGQTWSRASVAAEQAVTLSSYLPLDALKAARPRQTGPNTYVIDGDTVTTTVTERNGKIQKIVTEDGTAGRDALTTQIVLSDFGTTGVTLPEIAPPDVPDEPGETDAADILDEKHFENVTVRAVMRSDPDEPDPWTGVVQAAGGVFAQYDVEDGHKTYARENENWVLYVKSHIASHWRKDPAPDAYMLEQLSVFFPHKLIAPDGFTWDAQQAHYVLDPDQALAFVEQVFGEVGEGMAASVLLTQKGGRADTLTVNAGPAESPESGASLTYTFYDYGITTASTPAEDQLLKTSEVLSESVFANFSASVRHSSGDGSVTRLEAHATAADGKVRLKISGLQSDMRQETEKIFATRNGVTSLWEKADTGEWGKTDAPDQAKLDERDNYLPYKLIRPDELRYSAYNNAYMLSDSAAHALAQRLTGSPLAADVRVSGELFVPQEKATRLSLRIFDGTDQAISNIEYTFDYDGWYVLLPTDDAQAFLAAALQKSNTENLSGNVTYMRFTAQGKPVRDSGYFAYADGRLRVFDRLAAEQEQIFAKEDGAWVMYQRSGEDWRKNASPTQEQLAVTVFFRLFGLLTADDFGGSPYRFEANYETLRAQLASVGFVLEANESVSLSISVRHGCVQSAQFEIKNADTITTFSYSIASYGTAEVPQPA